MRMERIKAILREKFGYLMEHPAMTAVGTFVGLRIAERWINDVFTSPAWSSWAWLVAQSVCIIVFALAIGAKFKKLEALIEKKQPEPKPTKVPPVKKPADALVAGLRIYAESFEWIMMARKQAEEWDNQQIFRWKQGAHSKAYTIGLWADENLVRPADSRLIDFPEDPYTILSPEDIFEDPSLSQLERNGGLDAFASLRRKTIGLKQALWSYCTTHHLDLETYLKKCDLDGVAIRLVSKPPEGKVAEAASPSALSQQPVAPPAAPDEGSSSENAV